MAILLLEEKIFFVSRNPGKMLTNVHCLFWAEKYRFERLEIVEKRCLYEESECK